MRALTYLRCPWCHDGVRYTEAHAGYGILECRCDRWPVVDDIPIIQRSPIGHIEHTKGWTRYHSTNHRELVELIDAGQFEEALLRCLNTPRTLPGLTRLIGWYFSHNKLIVGLWNRRDQAALKSLVARRDALTATDVFEFFCSPTSPLGDGLREYFIYRFSQPRHLVALGLIESIPSATQPVLDVACGAGHLAHYLEHRSDPSAVIGCDFNFFHVWIAKHWIAPRADFVCTDLRDGLPFADGAFSATFCSDAYHCIKDRRTLLSEIERCAPGKPLVVTCAGNRSVKPNEGYETDVSGYLDEAPGAQVFHESGLLNDYLARRTPQPASPEEASRHKWVSFVRNPAPPRALSAQWPHAVGKLVLNPIYRVRAEGGALHLQHEFPSEWYEFENSGMLKYLPRELTLTQDELQRPAEELIRKAVFIGVPDRYSADSVREAAVATQMRPSVTAGRFRTSASVDRARTPLS